MPAAPRRLTVPVSGRGSGLEQAVKAVAEDIGVLPLLRAVCFAGIATRSRAVLRQKAKYSKHPHDDTARWRNHGAADPAVAVPPARPVRRIGQRQIPAC